MADQQANVSAAQDASSDNLGAPDGAAGDAAAGAGGEGQTAGGTQPPAGGRRIIKRYTNRKLYDTKESRYVTLLQIADMVRANEDVQIIDNTTKEDKTDLTLALIIPEELKARPRAIPLATLKALIRHRSGKLLHQLRDSPIGIFIPKEGEEHHEGEVEQASSETLGGEVPPLPTEEAGVSGSETQQKGLRATIEQWQHAIDDRIRAVLPTFSTIRDLQGELKRVSDRLDAIEKALKLKDDAS